MDLDVKQTTQLRDQARVPFAQRGLGSKRLLSIGMNVNASEDGTLVLVDEVETGLEPYRISALINQFRAQFKNHGQLIMTTHSISAVCECSVNEVCVCYNNDGELKLHRLNEKDAIKADVQALLDEIVNWAKESVAQLGCTPCTLAVGIGRSHFEAASMMLEAQVDGRYDVQNEMENEITRRVNEADIGPLGLHGKTSVLGTFLKVGPQRASGVRIVCIRPTCCFEPRIASVDL